MNRRTLSVPGAARTGNTHSKKAPKVAYKASTVASKSTKIRRTK